MPRVYLSPSTQEGNPFVSGGSEEHYMNLVADAAVPWLDASGILYTRNTPDMTASSSIRQSNEGDYDLHFAIHSNAAPEGRYGQAQGSLPYYHPDSDRGRILAEITAENARKIYPRPELVRTVPGPDIGELRQTRAPAVLWEVAYHDNVEDARWIEDNIENIGWAVAASIAQYLDVPLAAPQAPRQARVNTRSASLNIRQRPATTAPVLARAPKGAALTVLGQVDGGWSVVRYGGVTGYGATQYIG